ncbi:Quinol:cytochrome c oxidoreductase quinone-binding subunit 2 [Planctomycetales bacterium 10988]|nr:Quinol:cytochrome c oxidoreductase quinone-binding subunit 2 [Planctomycetales bacterium 10988]
MSDTSSPLKTTPKLEELTGRWLLLMIAGVVCLSIALVLGLFQGDSLSYFYHSYLTSFSFFLSIALGALFFVTVSHLVRMGWGVVFRRLSECMAASVWIFIPLFLVILLPMLLPLIGMGEMKVAYALFPWNAPELDDLTLHKTPYLNPGFFAIRAVVYFAVWIWLSRYFFTKSLKQDENGNKDLTIQMQSFSAPAMYLIGLTYTFASFDWLMSLDPHWFSTIFGVYFLAGAACAFFSAMIILSYLLQKRGLLKEAVNVEHFHDLGKLLFGFVCFWGYIAFSQFLLIWYANIPEETVWYLPRFEGPWFGLSFVLIFGHFVIPFLGLLSRKAKRVVPILFLWAIYMLVMHFADIFWLVMPQYYHGSAVEPAEIGIPFGVIDLLCILGVGGLYMGAFLKTVGAHSIVAIHDPRLDESLAFKNT